MYLENLFFKIFFYNYIFKFFLYLIVLIN